MTGVYSGGLVYEYSQEESNYGLVEINGETVTERPDYAELKTAFQKTKNPSGDGGYKSSGSASQCPTKSNTWNVTMSSDQLPAVPSGADELFKNGAGTGPGLTGDGSQSAGSETTELANAASGAVTSGGVSPSSSKGAAGSLRFNEFSVVPYVCSAVVVISTLFGGALIL